MKCSSNRLLVAEVVEDSRAFAALEGEWEDLYQNSPLATPFQSWAWLYSWWEAYGAYYKLQLIALRDGRGLLVGAMPLMLEHWQGLGKLLFIGTGLTDYLDMLARSGWEEEVSEDGMRALQHVKSWHVADLQQLRPDATTWSIFRKWPGPRNSVWQSSCPVIDVKPWDELVASLSRKQRSAIRRTVRRAEADGLRRALVGADDAEQAGRRLVDLHREAWRGRNIASTHLTREFESHMVAAAVRMTASELGAISEFWQDGEVIASTFLLFGHNSVGGYMGGARQNAWQRYQVSTLQIWDAMNIARTRNSSRLDLLRGEEPYKLRWNPTLVPNRRVILCRSPVLWGPYAGYHCLRSRAQRHLLAHPESTLRWVKALTAKSRALQYRAVK